MKHSKHSLDGQIITILPGLAIYKTHASPYYQVRIRVAKKYVVRSSKEKTKIKARQAAIELAREVHQLAPKVAAEYTFKHYALRWLELSHSMGERGERNPNYLRSGRLTVENAKWGLLAHFGEMDVRQIKTKHFLEFRGGLQKRLPTLAASTHGTISATFRNVMKVARDDGVIDFVPDTPRVKQQDNPRSFFRFKPLVEKDADEYYLLRKAALEMAREQPSIRGVRVTGELYDLILFIVHSFVRPINTELYALKHKHITVADDPKRLLVTVTNGKTGFRVANTMAGAVSAYKRLRQRYPAATANDYVFLPDYPNRVTAARIFQRQFNELLTRTGLKMDIHSGTARTLYSLRHTAICLRLIKSEGQVNIFNLAKNAGTSVEQIERFYAHDLPLSPELARNLQTMVARNSADK